MNNHKTMRYVAPYRYTRVPQVRLGFDKRQPSRLSRFCHFAQRWENKLDIVTEEGI